MAGARKPLTVLLSGKVRDDKFQPTSPPGDLSPTSPTVPHDQRRATAEAFVADAEGGSTRLIGLFAGHGFQTDAFHQLAEHYRMVPQCHGLVQQGSDLMDEFQRSHPPDESVGEVPFHLINALQDSASTPPPVLRSMSVAWPILFILQLVNVLLTACRAGLGYQRVHRALSAVLGNGQGMLAALCLSASPTEEELSTNFPKFLNLIMYAGYRHQQVLATIVKVNLEKYQACFRPTYMLSVVGLPIHIVDKLVLGSNDPVKNATLSTYSDLVISEILGPRAATVSGHPADLYRLHYSIWQFCKETYRTVRLNFLPVGGPRHTPFYLSQATRLILNAWRHDHLELEQFTYHIPVLSPLDGADLTTSPHITEEVASALTVSTQDMLRASQHFTNENVFDFGPGGAAGLGVHLHRLRPAMHILVQPGDLPLPPEPRPPRRMQRPQVFACMALFNEVLTDLRCPHHNLDFGTKWLELGLVRTVAAEKRAKKDAAATRRQRQSYDPSMAAELRHTSWDCLTGACGPVAHDDVFLDNPHTECTPMGLLFMEGVSMHLKRHFPPNLLAVFPTIDEVLNVVDLANFLDLDPRLASPRMRTPRTGRPQSPFFGVGRVAEESAPPPSTEPKRSSVKKIWDSVRRAGRRDTDG